MPIVRGDLLLAGLVAVAAVLRFHPVGVRGVVVVQRLLVGEDVGALLAVGLHGEVVGLAVVRVLDVQRGVRLPVGADHRGDPDEPGFVRGAFLGRDAHERHFEIAVAVDLVAVPIFRRRVRGFFHVFVAGLVVARVPVAVLVAFTVVPASHVQLVDARERLRLRGLLVPVERHVQVRPRVVFAGRPVDVARVAHQPDRVTRLQVFTFGHEHVGHVRVAGHVAVTVVDHHVVAVATAFVHRHHRAVRHRRHLLAVGLASRLREVERVGVVHVGVAVVAVAAAVVFVVGAVALREVPVLAGVEGKGQPDARTAHPVRLVVGGHDVRLAAHGHKGENARDVTQHVILLSRFSRAGS